MGRHRVEKEGAESALQPVVRRLLRSRIWASPAPLAAIGLITAISVVFGGWVLVGRDGGTSMVYPWTTDAPTPIDVSVTLIPSTEGPVVRASPRVVSRSPSASPTPSLSSSPGPGGSLLASQLTVTYRVDRSWHGAFRGEFVVTNGGSQAVDRWVLRASFPSGLDIYDLWEARSCAEKVTNELVAVSVRPLAAGQSIKVGFLAAYSRGKPQPSPVTVRSEPSGCPET